MPGMTRLAGLLIVAVAACGGGTSKSATAPGVTGAGSDVADPIPTTKGPDCAIVADRLATVAHADTPDRQAEARDMLRTRCADDKWNDEARNCFGSVETDAEVEGCAKHLTDAQRSHLHRFSPETTPKDPWGAPAGSKAEPATKSPAPRGGTRAPRQRNSSDPCEGGESKRNSSDPCEGGERK
jgi:hypothetical protein